MRGAYDGLVSKGLGKSRSIGVFESCGFVFHPKDGQDILRITVLDDLVDVSVNANGKDVLGRVIGQAPMLASKSYPMVGKRFHNPFEFAFGARA